MGTVVGFLPLTWFPSKQQRFCRKYPRRPRSRVRKKIFDKNKTEVCDLNADGYRECRKLAERDVMKYLIDSSFE